MEKGDLAGSNGCTWSSISPDPAVPDHASDPAAPRPALVGLGLGDPVPDANTIWTFREALTPPVDLAILEFGYQNHISADRRHRLIRRWLVTDAAAHTGARLADLLDPGNTASALWADTGYRSKRNEELLRERMLVSHIHRKKPAGRPMPERTARANARRRRTRF